MFSMWDMDFVSIKLKFSGYYPSPQYPQSYQFKLNNVNLEFIVEPDNYKPDPNIPPYMQPKLELMWIDLDKDDYPGEHWRELTAAMEKFIIAFKLPPVIEGLVEVYIEYMERKRRRKIEEDLYLCEREFKYMKPKKYLKAPEEDRMKELLIKIPKLRAAMAAKHFSTNIHKMFLTFLLRVPFRHTRYKFLNFITHYSYAAKYRQLALIELPKIEPQPEELGYEQLLQKFKLQEIEVNLLGKRAKLNLKLVSAWGAKVYNRIYLRRFSKAVSSVFRLLMNALKMKGKADVHLEPKHEGGTSGALNKFILDKLDDLLSDLNSTEPTVPIKALELAKQNEASISKLIEEAQITQLDLPNRISTAVREAVSKELSESKDKLAELVVENQKRADKMEKTLAKAHRMKEKYDSSLKTLEEKTESMKQMFTQTKSIADDTLSNYQHYSRQAYQLKELQDEGFRHWRQMEDRLKGLPKVDLDMHERVKLMLDKAEAIVKDPELLAIKQTISSAQYTARNFERALPKACEDLEKLKLTVEQYRKTFADGWKMIEELRSATRETFQGVATANSDRILQSKLETKQERMRDYRARKAERSRVQFTHQEKKTVNEELIRSERKIVEFCRDWGSLRNGDLYSYQDKLIEITNEFNPSIRVKHTGQNGDIWQIQKHANAKWFNMGHVGF